MTGGLAAFVWALKGYQAKLVATAQKLKLSGTRIPGTLTKTFTKSRTRNSGGSEGGGRSTTTYYYHASYKFDTVHNNKTVVVDDQCIGEFSESGGEEKQGKSIYRYYQSIAVEPKPAVTVVYDSQDPTMCMLEGSVLSYVLVEGLGCMNCIAWSMVIMNPIVAALPTLLATDEPQLGSSLVAVVMSLMIIVGARASGDNIAAKVIRMMNGSPEPSITIHESSMVL